MNTSSVSSSEEEVSSPLLGKYPSMPPASMRSSKSMVNQVKNTLFSFLKKKSNQDEKENKNVKDGKRDTNSSSMHHFSPETVYSRSQKLRTREAFLDRILTFTIPKWMGKPLALSPPLLAQYGWQCIGVDSIKCCSCSAIVSVRLPWPDVDNCKFLVLPVSSWSLVFLNLPIADRVQCASYRQKIVTGHMKICSWPSYPCPDSFVTSFHHGAAASEEIRQDYIERKKGLLTLGDHLPQIKKDLLEEMKLDEKNIEAILKIDHTDNDTGDPVTLDVLDSKLSSNATAAVLALCGWNIKCVSNKASSISCKSTGRTIGLWNFYSICEDSTSGANNDRVGAKRPASDSEEQEVSSPKRLKTNESLPSSPSHLKIEKSWFHPLQQHHPWSPWITVLKPISKYELEIEATNASLIHIANPCLDQGKPGWEVVRDALVGKKGEGDEKSYLTENTTPLTVPTSKQMIEDQGTPNSKQKLLDSPPRNTPPKSAVLHVRKLLKEWSSPS